MERTVSNVSVALLLCTAVSGAFAGSVAGTGGATEVTQLLNNGELINQTSQQIATVSNTLSTANATLQQLKQLDPSVIAKMTGLPLDQIQKLGDAYKVMSSAVGVYNQAANVLKQAQQDAAALKVTPSALLQMKANVAAAYGGMYQQQYSQEQDKLTQLAQTAKDVQDSAASISGIDAGVKGVQFLANQNLKVQSLLVQLNDSVATANSNAARAKVEQKTLEQQKAIVDAANAENANNIAATDAENIKKINAAPLLNPTGQ
jgi:DNA-binding transcriptional MerR regulator